MLRGRQAECAAIDTLLEQVRRGVSGVLLVRGEPGIGKTALLEHALGVVDEDVRVLRCMGYESESQVPFAGLHQALRRSFGAQDKTACGSCRPCEPTSPIGRPR